MRLALLTLVALTAAPTARAQTFVREAVPFPVRDAAGAAVPFPFAGGFFEPRPNVADLDGAGDADLVLNVGGAGLQLFERVGAGAAARYEWRTDRLSAIEPGNWAAFGDLDGDGDLDLVTRGDPGRVRAYRNTGTAQSPAFERVSALLLAPDGEPVAIEDSSIPDLADGDGDGDLDLLAGRADLGNITFYRNEGVDAAGAPRFALVTNTFEDIQVYEANPQCGGGRAGPLAFPGPGGPAAPAIAETARRHGANALRLVDVTADGRPELFWGDFFAPSLFFFGNTGTPADPLFTLVSERFPVGQPLTSGGYNASDFGDADGDGDLDLIVGVQRGLCFDVRSAIDNLILFENAGTAAAPDFQRRTDRLLGAVDVGSRATVAPVDVDGDGDLDLVVGSETAPDASGRARLALYRNTGTATAPEYALEDADFLSLAYDYGGYGPVAGDLDADGDPDLLVGGFNGRFALVRNDGTATAPVFALDAATVGNPGYEGVDAGQYARGALGDVDGDGDLDLVTGASSGRVRLYRNVGTALAADFLTEANGTPQAADLAYALALGIPDVAGQDSAPALADLDGDGDLDLLVGVATGAIRIFRNTGTQTAPAFTEDAPLLAGRRRTAPALADLDGDGDADLLAGTDAGGLLFWRAAGGTPAEPGPETGGLRIDVFPNPSSGASRFVASARVRGEATVFDVRGREVRRVRFDGREAEWDGRDAAGRALPAGVYVLRVPSPGGVVSARFTRVG